MSTPLESGVGQHYPAQVAKGYLSSAAQEHRASVCRVTSDYAERTWQTRGSSLFCGGSELGAERLIRCRARNPKAGNAEEA